MIRSLASVNAARAFLYVDPVGTTNDSITNTFTAMPTGTATAVLTASVITPVASARIVVVRRITFTQTTATTVATRR